MIKKRKSVRKFDENLSVSEADMEQLQHYLKELVALNDTRVAFRIVPRGDTTAKWGEYCLLAYSEKKQSSWLNVGYLLEQVDLFMASLDIGACWYGMSKPDQNQHDGLEYVIMLAFGKSSHGDFRKDLAETKRKAGAEIWAGDFDQEVVDLVRYAPSACNIQPWRVVSKGKTMRVQRTTAYRSMIPPSKRHFFNSIDLGIFLCFLDIILRHQGYSFARTLLTPTKNDEKKLIPIAEYTIND